jgi:TetR/AcrR family transcriptional regulator, cholesterol catabolism regulator
MPGRRFGRIMKNTKVKRRQQEFLDAAAAVFAAKGFHGATTGDIAARLGIRQGSLYYYFRSKEEALEQVCLIGVQGFVHNIEAIDAAAGTLRDKIAAIVAAHVGALETKRDFVVVFLDQRQHLPYERRREVSAQSRRYVGVIEEMLAAGVAGGEARADLDCRLAALSLVGLCNAVAGWQSGEPAPSLDRATAAIVGIFVDGIRGPG